MRMRGQLLCGLTDALIVDQVQSDLRERVDLAKPDRRWREIQWDYQTSSA